MSEYTPDTEAVRDAYASFWERRYGPAVWYERCQDEFDRWLEAEKAKWQAEAWEEGHRHAQRRGPDDRTCEAWSEDECACGQFGNGELWSLADNPYREQP